MKYSWNSLKVSITGARLSHLVQKDKIWDHGSMTEQTRIIFHLVQKAKKNRNMESLKKQCTTSCIEKLKAEMYPEEKDHAVLLKDPVIKELSVVEVHPGRNKKPDMFTVLIKAVPGNQTTVKNAHEVTGHWSFVRQGEWWLLDKIKIHRRFFKNF